MLKTIVATVRFEDEQFGSIDTVVFTFDTYATKQETINDRAFSEVFDRFPALADAAIDIDIQLHVVNTEPDSVDRADVYYSACLGY